MSVAAAVVSTVKLLVVPSALIALAASALTGLAVPAVPVKTSTFPASASAGAAPAPGVASIAPASASDRRTLRETGGTAALDIPIPTPSSGDITPVPPHCGRDAPDFPVWRGRC